MFFKKNKFAEKNYLKKKNMHPHCDREFTFIPLRKKLIDKLLTAKKKENHVYNNIENNISCLLKEHQVC